MSITKLLLVTFPENLFNIYLAFLLTGYRLYLPFRDNKEDRRNNVVKLLITVGMFSLVQFLGRRFIQDIAIYFIFNILFSVIILGVVYSKLPAYKGEKKFTHNLLNIIKSFRKPLIQVSIMFCSLYFLEAIFIPPLMQTLKLQSVGELFSIQWINLLFPQIDRFLQFLAISMLWNYQRLNHNILQYHCKKSLFLLPIIYIIVAEFIIIYLYIIGFNTLNIQVKIILFIFIVSMIPFNLFLYKIVLNVIDRIYKNYIRRKEYDNEDITS